jgi:LmbE family N-acetylglucosaminyl deacetylase
VQVPLLLRDMHIEMRTLGAELLAVFTRVQSPVDSKLDAIQAHVPQVQQVADTNSNRFSLRTEGCMWLPLSTLRWLSK